MESTENKNQEGPRVPIVETDVLGLAKDTGSITNGKSKPNVIFIVLAVLAVIGAIYWWYNK